MASEIFVRAEDDDDELEPRPALPCNDDDEGDDVDQTLVPTTAEEYLRMVGGGCQALGLRGGHPSKG
jgi:hypothetical protein